MNNDTTKNGERGFSLIELLIVIIIMSIVTASIFSLLNQSLQIGRVSNQGVEVQQSLRTAQEYINRDLYNAGDNLTGFNPMINGGFAFNYLSRNLVAHPTFGNLATPSAGVVMTGIILSDDRAPGSVIPVANPREPGLMINASADRITFLTTPDPGNAFPEIGTVLSGKTNNALNEIYVNTASITDASGNAMVFAGDIYLLYNTGASGTSTGSAFVAVTGVIPTPARAGVSSIQFGTGANGLGLNSGVVNKVVSPTPSNDGTLTSLTLKRVWIINYFVDDQNRLSRRVFGQRTSSVGLPFTESIIAENVTDLQFSYTLRRVVTDGQGVITNILPPETDNQLTTTNELDWVRQVRVSITTQSSRPVINNQPQVFTSSTVISPRNMQFRGALQPGS